MAEQVVSGSQFIPKKFIVFRSDRKSSNKTPVVSLMQCKRAEWNCVLFHQCTAMTGIAAVALQNGMDLLKDEPDSCDDSEVTDVKVEAVTIKEEEVIIKEEEGTVTDEEVTIKEEEDPLLIRLPLIEAEHEVSCRTVYPLLCHFASTQKCLVSFFCLSVCA